MQLPTVFVLGAESPLNLRHNIATAALIPTASYQIEDSGHVVWMEQPGAIHRTLDCLAAAQE